MVLSRRALARFGFLPDPQNPDGLPVGVAKDTVVDPNSGETVEVVGLTCSACHTGQLEYKGKGIRIDGGQANVDLASFQTELGYAVGFADKIPLRFDRFAKVVLGENASDDTKRKLRQEFEAFLQKGLDEKNEADNRRLYAAAGGFGRTDALARIGNFVFGTELDNTNLRVANAPVSFPPLWYAPWFDWVQYNASIEQPMVRNVGEALGVRARVNLTDPSKLFRSTVNVKSLHEIETLLAGPAPFAGLGRPAWPEQILGPIDRAKAERGKEIYQHRCQGCHLPPLDSTDIEAANSPYWRDGLRGHRFLHMNVIPLEKIGTDPNAATDWSQRTAKTGALGLGTVSAADGLRIVTRNVADAKYDQLGLSPDQRMEWNGFRDDRVLAPLGYKARPLAGIWATAPYLHNGSVPTLYQLLLPADRRDKIFYLGSHEFDPKNVGVSTTKIDGAFEFRTEQTGNSNASAMVRPAKACSGRNSAMGNVGRLSNI